jgi:hypothetical protein
VSDIGNSDVPYPYAIGEKYTYIMLDFVYHQTSKIDLNSVYQYHYDCNSGCNATKIDIVTLFK